MNEKKAFKKEEIKDVPLSAIISTIHRFHSIYINKELKEYGLTIGQFPFLMHLYHSSMINQAKQTQNELAETFQMTEGTVARALQKLEEKGLIEREIDSENRRRNLISITAKGKTIANKFKDLDNNWEKEIYKNLTEEEVIKLKWQLHIMGLKAIERESKEINTQKD